MCGRAYFPANEEILKALPIHKLGRRALDIKESKLLVPGVLVPIVTSKDSQLMLTSAHWGYDDIYNARAETIELKALWSSDYFERRLVFPLKGFYEGGKWFSSFDEEQILFAGGIYRIINKTTFSYLQASMITVESTGLIRRHHHRLPAIIKYDQIESWLDLKVGIYDSILSDQESLRITDAMFYGNKQE